MASFEKYIQGALSNLRLFLRRISWEQAVYIIFILTVAGAYFILSPGWGFMDDWQSRERATLFWQGKMSFPDLINEDLQVFGRFRPLLYLWIVLAYQIPYPLFLYFLIFATGAWVLLIWGKIIHQLLPEGGMTAEFKKYVYPLSFFAFLPFWNTFMYISLQEKFIFIFGTLSLWFLVKSYRNNSFGYLWGALSLAFLSILGKETGVVFLFSYAGYAALDLLIFKKNIKISKILLLVSVIAGFSYVIFIKTILGGYTAHYKSNLNIGVLLGMLKTIPGMMKVAIGIAGLSILTAAYFWWGKRRQFLDPLFLICPLWMIIYILLLLPWGFPNYLLAPLAPFIMVSIYFLIAAWMPKQKPLIYLAQAAIIVIVFLVLLEIIIPRISKMADKRKVVEAIVALNKENPGKFFYPPHYQETAGALQNFSSVPITYASAINEKNVSFRENSFLVINDEADAVVLENIYRDQLAYQNGTWQIWVLKEKKGQKEEFRLTLPLNTLQKIKSYLTSR
ncbi:MAG: hypothetical protein WC676_00310 [Candidatus Omnitrophota bacterium]